MLNKLVKTPNKRDLVQVSKWANVRNDDAGAWFKFCGYRVELGDVTKVGTMWFPKDETLPDFIAGSFSWGLNGFYVELSPDGEQIRVYREVR